MVPLSIFKMKTLSAANGIAVTVGAALFGMYFFLSLYLQQVNGYSPLKAGLAFLPAGLATMAGALTAARLVARIGPRRQLVTGLLLAAVGLAWMSTVRPRTPATSPMCSGRWCWSAWGSDCRSCR